MCFLWKKTHKLYFIEFQICYNTHSQIENIYLSDKKYHQILSILKKKFLRYQLNDWNIDSISITLFFKNCSFKFFEKLKHITNFLNNKDFMTFNIKDCVKLPKKIKINIYSYSHSLEKMEEIVMNIISYIYDVKKTLWNPILRLDQNASNTIMMHVKKENIEKYILSKPIIETYF